MHVRISAAAVNAQHASKVVLKYIEFLNTRSDVRMGS